MAFGWIVAIIILAGIAMWWLMFFFFIRAGYHIYRTGRYFYKDLEPWIEQFKQFGEGVQTTVTRIGEGGARIAATGEEMRGTFEEIADVVDEVRYHPYVRTARMAGKITSKL